MLFRSAVRRMSFEVKDIAYTCDIDALNNKVDSLEKISHDNNESIATIMNEYPTVDEVNDVLKEYALKKDIPEPVDLINYALKSEIPEIIEGGCVRYICYYYVYDSV